MQMLPLFNKLFEIYDNHGMSSFICEAFIAIKVYWVFIWCPGRLSYSKLGLSHPWAGLSHCFSFPGGASGKESACQCKRPKNLKFDPWVRKTPWSRKWQPTLVFSPEKLHTHTNHWFGTSQRETWKEWVPELDVKVVRQSQNTTFWVMHQKNPITIFTLFSYSFFLLNVDA